MKTSLLTLIFVSFLQIKVKQKTLEFHTLHWIKNSSLIQPFHNFTQNGISIFKKKLTQTKQKIQFKLLNEPTEYPQGKRLQKLKLKRNQAVIDNLNKIKEEKKEDPTTIKNEFKKPARTKAHQKEHFSKKKEPNLKTKISSSSLKL